MRKIARMVRQTIATPPTTPPMIGPRGVESFVAAEVFGSLVAEPKGTGDDALGDGLVVVIDEDADVSVLDDPVLVDSTVDEDVVEEIDEATVDEDVDEVVVAETGGGRAKMVSTPAFAPHAI